MVYPENLTPEEFQLLRTDPRVWAQNMLRHPNDPDRRYDFRTTDGDTKVNYLLNNNGPLNPESWGNINVLKLARGCLKSTSMRIVSNWALHMYLTKGIEIYMTAPREGQINNLTDDLQRNIEMSGLDAAQIKDNQQYKKFEVIREDESGNTFPVHAKFEADSGWGEGDALRGPHSHLGIIDETQDIEKPAFDTFVQCIDQELPGVPYFPAIFVIGTPKLTNSFFHDLWEQSDQKTWDRESRSYIPQAEADAYTAISACPECQADVRVTEGGEAVQCTSCDHVVEEADPWTVRGWHVDQFNSPLHDERAIARDRENFSPMKFSNEVAAEFYSPADNLLDTETLQRVVFDEDRGFSPRRHSEDSFVTTGVDWGGGSDKNAADTVIINVEWQSYEGAVEGTVLDIEFLDDDLTASEEVRAVERHIMRYETDNAIVDYGHGYKSMEDLQDGVDTLNADGYVDVVSGAKYGNIKDKSQVKWEDSSGKRRFFTCDKTHSIQQTVDSIKRGEVTIPTEDLSFARDADDGTKLINHLTAPYKDYTTTPSGAKKVRVQKDDNRNDDSLDSLTYAWLGYHKVGPRTTPATIASKTRPGY